MVKVFKLNYACFQFMQFELSNDFNSILCHSTYLLFFEILTYIIK